jgi:hypothetical protein
MIGGLSPLHWLLILVLISPVFAMANVIKRVGHSPWLALLFLIPMVNWVFLWVFAYMRWPIDQVAKKAE